MLVLDMLVLDMLVLDMVVLALLVKEYMVARRGMLMPDFFLLMVELMLFQLLQSLPLPQLDMLLVPVVLLGAKLL